MGEGQRQEGVSEQCAQGDLPCRLAVWILSIPRGGRWEKEKEGGNKKTRESSKITFNCVVNAIFELKESWQRTLQPSITGTKSSPCIYHSDVGSRVRQHGRQTLRGLLLSVPP